MADIIYRYNVPANSKTSAMNAFSHSSMEVDEVDTHVRK